MRCLLTLALLSISLGAEMIVVSPKYTKGQKIGLEMTKGREDTRAGRITGVTTTPIELIVLEATAAGTVVSWTSGETKFADAKQAANPIVQRLMKAAASLAFEVNLSKDGEFVGLRNQAEAGAALEKLMSVVVEEVSGTIPEADRARFAQTIRGVFGPQALIQSATKEIQLYFGMAGVELDSSETLSVPMKIPNPLGGDPISSTLVFNVKKVDRTTKTAEIEVSQEFDPRVFESMARQLATQAGLAGPDGKLPPGKMYDRSISTIDLTTGWTRHVRHVRTTEVGDSIRRVETTEIRVVQ